MPSPAPACLHTLDLPVILNVPEGEYRNCVRSLYR